jgi:hypothetical protein
VIVSKPIPVQAAVWVAGLLLLLSAGLPARADTFQTFNLAYSGAALGNNATAAGQIVFDETLLPNPGGSNSAINFVQDFTLTISGASSGNGTFTFSDFRDFYWDTGGATLDLARNLIGQPTAGAPWGTTYDGSSGDFNAFGVNSAAPYGSYYFTLVTSNGTGDQMQLTSFAATPEPGSSSLLALAGLLLLAVRCQCFVSFKRNKHR